MPANPEQVQIVRALDRHRAVLVQGPPGTGKSYTIANLIGHLVAQGKRVLVTSHTTKALRVLRDLIVDSLQPLAVAVLDNDLEGRALMEKAVRGIVSRLATANEVQLSADITRLAEKRQRLIEEIERITDELRLAREAEYRDILVGGGDTIDPTHAAREANSGHECNCWLPGSLNTGAPLPLSGLEIRELYASNAAITEEEEREVSDDLPPPSILKNPEAFQAAITVLGAVEPVELAALWEHPPEPINLDPLRELIQGIESFSRELATLEYWQRSVVAAGHAGHGEREIWVSLRAQIVGAAERWDKARAQFLNLSPETSNCLPRAVLQSTVIEIRNHLVAGGKIGSLTLFFNGRWKKAVDGCRVNGEPPSTSPHFASIAARLKIDDGREQLARQWNRQAVPAGFPAYEKIPDPPEPVLRGYADQVDDLLDWWHQRWSTLEKLLNAAGFRWKLFRDREMAKLPPSTAFELDAQLLAGPLIEVVGTRLRMLECRAAEIMLKALDQTLTAYHGPTCLALRQAVRGHNPAAYSVAYNDYERLVKRVSVWSRRKELLNKLEAGASGWAVAIRAREGVHGGADPPGDVTAAWRWRQIEQEVNRRASLDDMSLKRRLEIRRVELHETTIDLIDRKAWLAQRRRTGLGAQQALIGWSDIQNRIGRGTGKRVPALQAEARRLLAKAQEAVPVWIMPLSRVAESFDPTQKKFDVVIVDEASQADVTGLLACYLGDQIAIVGDHEQVSPSAVGQKLDEITTLIEQHLVGIPNSILYDGKTSIYHLARQSFGGTIGLREHFRCVPDIIEFSNYLSYGGEIRPLRDPRTAPTPHVIEYAVPPGLGSIRGDNKTNEAEARIIAALSAAAMEDDSYRGKSMGAITLLGEEQAWMILEKLRQLVRSEELERRHFVAGNSAQFQGDERHIIWLSMVDTPKDGPLPIRQTVEFKQRFTVAASRAKDQLGLVHSLDPGRDLQNGDLRRQLIEHVRDPGSKRRTILQAQIRAESEFEKDVIQRLVGAGFKVQPQVWAGYHRIDIVVSDEAGQVAIECDGDRHHPFDKIPEDMARQAILERAGWRFIRIRGTRFYRNPDGAMEWVASELQRLGVRPVAVDGAGAFFVDQAGQERKDAVIRRAWEIMREQGWVAEP
jgi:very-short-patch-repair endonuclease